MPPEPATSTPGATPGQFPEPLTPVARNLGIDIAVRAVAKAVETGLMAAIHGPSGAGKTAAAQYACHQVGGDWVYVQAPYKGRVKDVISAWYATVIGRPPTSTARNASDQLVHELWDRRIGLVVDEVHYTGNTGIQAIRYVHDQIAATYGYRFPIVLVGAELDTILAAAGAEMARRAPWRARFGPLPDADINVLLPTMHPRFAGMDPRLVTVVNKKYAHGLPGRWANVALAAADTPGTGTFTRQHIADALHLLGATQ